jgi:hypothetical protein
MAPRLLAKLASRRGRGLAAVCGVFRRLGIRRHVDLGLCQPGNSCGGERHSVGDRLAAQGASVLLAAVPAGGAAACGLDSIGPAASPGRGTPVARSLRRPGRLPAFGGRVAAVVLVGVSRGDLARGDSDRPVVVRLPDDHVPRIRKIRRAGLRRRASRLGLVGMGIPCWPPMCIGIPAAVGRSCTHRACARFFR